MNLEKRTTLESIDKFVTNISKSGDKILIYFFTLILLLFAIMLICDVPKTYIWNKYGNNDIPVEIITKDDKVKEYVFKKYIAGELVTIVISGEDMKIEHRYSQDG